MKAQLIVVFLNTVAHNDNRYIGPEDIKAEADIRPTIQKKFDTVLKGVPGYVLVSFNGKLWQCERNANNPNKPYVRNEITYHPLYEKFASRSGK